MKKRFTQQIITANRRDGSRLGRIPFARRCELLTIFAPDTIPWESLGRESWNTAKASTIAEVFWNHFRGVGQNEMEKLASGANNCPKGMRRVEDTVSLELQRIDEETEKLKAEMLAIKQKVRNLKQATQGEHLKRQGLASSNSIRTYAPKKKGLMILQHARRVRAISSLVFLCEKSIETRSIIDTADNLFSSVPFKTPYYNALKKQETQINKCMLWAIHHKIYHFGTWTSYQYGIECVRKAATLPLKRDVSK
jgi:hypothetical protein